MPKYKVGQVLQNKNKQFGTVTILAVLDLLYGLEGTNLAGVFWQKESWLEINGYTLAQPARWVPEIGERYVFLDDSGFKGIVKWEDSNIDRFRLSIGNVFQVGDHAGIEAFKRRLQEGNKI